MRYVLVHTTGEHIYSLTYYLNVVPTYLKLSLNEIRYLRARLYLFQNLVVEGFFISNQQYFPDRRWSQYADALLSVPH